MKVSIGEHVKLVGLSVPMAIAHTIVVESFRSCGYDCTMTSATDRTHSRASLHYIGNGSDYSYFGVSPYNRLKIRDDVKVRLGREFDVVDEGDHLHVEWQPKEASR